MNVNEYYTEDQWHRALGLMGQPFQLAKKEYHPTKFGMLKSISCNVMETYDHYLPGTTVHESAPVLLTWAHNGACHKGRKRYEKFDLTTILRAIAKDDKQHDRLAKREQAKQQQLPKQSKGL